MHLLAELSPIEIDVIFAAFLALAAIVTHSGSAFRRGLQGTVVESSILGVVTVH